MSKIHMIVILILFASTYSLPALSVNTSTPRFFTSRNGEFEMDMNVSIAAEASYLGVNSLDRSGVPASIAGDVNGDGYDDLIITAVSNNIIVTQSEAYLVFGKSSGWSKDVSLSNADASFLEEALGDQMACTSSGGDVNGDGYDDLLFVSPQNSENGRGAGQAYLVFGKASGWKTDFSLSGANASFLGEYAGDQVYWGTMDGDLNGDGYDDIIICSWMNGEGGTGAGQTYLICGRSTGWKMDMNLSLADASFIGEGSSDQSGSRADIIDDVNGDGLDDLIIGAQGNSDGGTSAGKTYLIFGNRSGWSMDTDLSNADATFIGEAQNDLSGFVVSEAGDVNGDGYGDFLIGAHLNDAYGQDAGQVYLVFGKTTGWKTDTPLSGVDASFLGENASDNAGYSVSDAGDINGDGYGDILIGAPYSDGPAIDSGQAYLIMGKKAGWKMDTLLSGSNASFMGESSSDLCGWYVSGGGDVDGEGFDDILIGAPANDESAQDAGQTYLVKGIKHTEPLSVYSVKAYNDDSFTDEMERADLGETIYIQMEGADGDREHVDLALVRITSTSTIKIPLEVYLKETGSNTGVYRGKFKVPAICQYLENITIRSFKDPYKYARIKIQPPMKIWPPHAYYLHDEDDRFDIDFTNIGYVQGRWTYRSDAEWLTWNESTHNLAGIPQNNHIGSWSVRIGIENDPDLSDEIEITIDVKNTPPRIQTENVVNAYQNSQYSVDYESDDEGKGDTLWSADLDLIQWLNFDPDTGRLNGTPGQDDIGSHHILISIDDGNGGTNRTDFELNVIDVNDFPSIRTVPLFSIDQNEPYYVDFTAVDIDGDSSLMWSLESDASWLSIRTETGELSGTPANDDVGYNFVNVTVTDPEGASDWINYTLEVVDINDDPVWIDVPYDVKMDQGDLFRYQVKALDIDKTDTIVYRLKTDPDVGMTIDPHSGSIEWKVTTAGITPNPDYIVQVMVFAEDGEKEISHWFSVYVIPDEKPVTSILSPENGKKVPSAGIVLRWEGVDKEGADLTYDLYIHEDRSLVDGNSKEALYAERLSDNRYSLEDLEYGLTYYWKVVPFDGFQSGFCEGGVHEFHVNTIPVCTEIEDQKVKAGEIFTYTIGYFDPDPDDSDNIEIILLSENEDMNLVGSIFSWETDVEDIGRGTIEIMISDGMESSTFAFNVTVEEVIVPEEVDEGDGFGLVVILVPAGIMVLVIVAVSAILIIKRKKRDEVTDDLSEMNDGSGEVIENGDQRDADPGVKLE